MMKIGLNENSARTRPHSTRANWDLTFGSWTRRFAFAEGTKVEVVTGTLSVYVPKWVAASIRDRWVDDDAPFTVQRRAAVLFLDVAGFSERTEKLAPLGARGAEELSTLLNGCFA